jgi:murein DD-endopeptidase MepM/ murein hydrolase activator NlpD
MRTRLRFFAAWCGLGLAAVATTRAAEPVELAWPSPNPAWAAGKPPAAFLQDAGSGDPESGGFGGVRTGGTQFHEGIDIKAVSRDRRGEPTDEVFAAMTGVVRHVSASPGNSSYGRYIVIEHPDVSPAVYTLYAHLSRIAPEVRVGTRVTRGQVIGTMGHSSGGYTIPKERSHLHFEIGLMVTQNFQAWYDRRGFGSKNEHGVWNGMNLMGMDPIRVFDEWKAGRLKNFADYFARLEPAVTVRIATRRVPDFVTRYPGLLTKALPVGFVGGWEIKCTWTGLPFSWTPLTPAEVAGLPEEQPRIVSFNADIERRQRSRTLVVQKRAGPQIGSDLQEVLQQLFGLR